MNENYYSLGKEELLRKLSCSEYGLSSQEANKRLEEYGLNDISLKDKRSTIEIFLSQFKSPLILILLGATVIAGILGDPQDALIILGIVVINACLSFYQEFKSEKALAELRKYISFKAKVLRDGQEIELDVRELVPGDIVFLEIGDIVPADLRLIKAEDLTLNESVVTGESFPVHKIIEIINIPNTQLSQQKNIAFMGTSVAGGEGKGIVIATGERTEFGRTANILSAKEPPTDFQKSIKKFGNFLIKIILLLTIFVFASNYLLGKNLLESFLFALALAVGIAPELLPIIITISLSAGAVHLAKKKVIVKRLVSIEDLGNIDVLCMDKTGTLTENQITLENYFDFKGIKSRELIELGLICNSAIIEKSKARGNVIDVAIWDYAKKEGITPEKFTKIKAIEFDYERRRMSFVIEKSGKRFLVCKGGPESIVSVCISVQNGSQLIPVKEYEKELIQKFRELSNEGFRVIAIATKEIEKKKSYGIEDEKELTFKGFIAFLDPPKKTAIQSLKEFQNLNVELKVLTGDNELVTEEIGREIGLKIKGKIILGSEIEKMNEIEFLKAIEENNIFARITPEQKYRIVEGLGKRGHIVGFLGDGVNDAPALKAADVGITVDSAVDVAKDSADIILLKKSLMVIADGIKQGRKTFGNIIKYIFNTISANFGNMFTLAFSSLFLKFIPLLPSQILLANLVSDIPLITVSTDNVDEDYLHNPKRWNIKTISNFMVYFGIISSVFDFITIGFLMFIVGADAAIFRTAWFLESVLSEIIVTFAIRTKRSFWQSHPSKVLIYSSIAAMILTIALVYSPLAFLFRFESLAVPVLVSIGVILLAYFLLVEGAKKKFFQKHEI
ncbi:MAG: magnesium-translocating P-type ATPase [Candidatus Diapherotrites archaeon]